jgi:hypothetical protein
MLHGDYGFDAPYIPIGFAIAAVLEHISAELNLGFSILLE